MRTRDGLYTVDRMEDGYETERAPKEQQQSICMPAVHRIHASLWMPRSINILHSVIRLPIAATCEISSTLQNSHSLLFPLPLGTFSASYCKLHPLPNRELPPFWALIARSTWGTIDLCRSRLWEVSQASNHVQPTCRCNQINRNKSSRSSREIFRQRFMDSAW